MAGKKVVKEKLMAFRLTLGRSNPMVMREIELQGSYSVRDFTDAVCIAFGIAPVNGELIVENAEGDTLRELFSENDRGELLLSKNASDNMRKRLCIYVDRIVPDKGIPDDPDIPCVLGATAANLPGDIWDVRDINYVLMNRNMPDITLGNVTYYPGELEYVQKKTLNALRKRFAPETAEREVNPAVKIPMRQLIGSNKLDALKQICEKNHIYLYAGTRKAEVVERICFSFDRDELRGLIQDMNILEYLYFRDYLLDENDTRTDKLTEDYLSMFCKRGLITYVAPKGYCIASELAELFEEIYLTPKEEKLVKNKYVLTAAEICGDLYGVIDYRMFDIILDCLKANCLSDDEKKHAYARLGDTFNYTQMVGGRYCYNSGKLKQQVIDRVVDRRGPSDEVFIPDMETIKALLFHGIKLSKESTDTLTKLISQNRSYYYYGQTPVNEVIKAVTESIHWGELTEDTVRIIEDHLYRSLQWQPKTTVNRLKEQIKGIVEKEAKEVPLAGLNGFSLNNCPENMKSYYIQIRDKQEAEIRVRRNKAASAKKRYW